MGHWVRRLWVIAWVLAPSVVRAQLAPVGVPAGVLRAEVDGAFDSWDSRFRDGRSDALGSDLTSSALGSDLFPILADAEARIERLTGLPSYRLNLGALTTDAHADVTRALFGLSLGVTTRITVFGRVPLVRSRVQAATTFDPSLASAGPAAGEQAQVAFFQQLDGAVTDLGSRLAAGQYDADPALRALAVATLAEGIGFRDDLFAVLGDPATAAPFVPTTGSEAGLALDARLETLRTTLATRLGVTGFTADPTLAAEPITPEEFELLLTDPSGPVAIRPTGNSLVTFRGDAEAGVAVTLLDRWDRGSRRGGLRAAAEALVRFPTGLREPSDQPLAIGTGDGQTDIELRVVADVGAGRLGARLEGGYNRQFAAAMVDRVAPPTQPLAGSDLLAVVRRDPGDEITFAARPFFRLVPTLALIGTVQRWSRGEDAVEYRGETDAIPGVDPSVLALETRASATVLGLGLTYSNPGSLLPGGRGLPVDAGWSYERVVSASGGRVPEVHRIRARVRVYFGIF